MKYGIITIGSQGDIDPFIALGKRLQSQGHYVRVATLGEFEEYVKKEGFEYTSLAGDATEVIRLLIGEPVSHFNISAITLEKSCRQKMGLEMQSKLLNI